LRFLDSTVAYTAVGNKSYQTTGEGIGASMIVPQVPTKLAFQNSGLFGRGVGRYATLQLPDVTFNGSGKIEPLNKYSVRGGFVAHPIPVVDIDADAGAEGAAQKSYPGGFGYGDPEANLTGCFETLGSCSAVTSHIVEGTVGAWWAGDQVRLWHRATGHPVRVCRPHRLPRRRQHPGQFVDPSMSENIFLFSVRYLAFR
jgi:hypothetical protein